MLGYEWGNPLSIMLSGVEGDSMQYDSDQSHHGLDPYTQTFNEVSLINPHAFNNTSDHHHRNHFRQLNSNQTQIQFQSVYEPRLYGVSYPPAPPVDPVLSLEPVVYSTGSVQNGFMVVPKSEPVGLDFTPLIDLNLGGRTYLSSSGDDYFVNLLYNRRSRMAEPSSLIYPRCQAEGCNTDLTHGKHYHRRHKVCEFHSKAAAVIAGGLTQRFCQQCSRFHLLSEFDNGKRSCRNRLADHNRRRRKSHQQSQEQQNKRSKFENAYNSSSENIPRSPAASGAQSTSSATVSSTKPPTHLLHRRQLISSQMCNNETSKILTS